MADEMTPDQELAAAIAADFGEPAPPARESEQPEINVESAVQPQAEAPKEEPPKVEPSATPVSEFKLSYKGQDRKVTQDELIELGHKGLDYTQKTMELAEQRREVERIAKEAQDKVRLAEEREAARQNELRSFLLNKERLSAYLSALNGGASVAAPAAGGSAAAEAATGDEDLVSKAEVSRLISSAVEAAKAALKSEVKKEVEASAASTREQVEIDRMADSYRADFDRTVDSLVTEKFPLLTEFGPPDIRDRIKEEGKNLLHAKMTLNPGVTVPPSEIKDAMISAARRWSEGYEVKLREREKRFVTSQATLTERGTEPRGGSAPPQPTSRPMRLNDPKLDEQVVNEIRSIMGLA